MYEQANMNDVLPFQGGAINELFAQHYEGSLRIAYRILRSREDSEDAVQTAYCAAFRAFDGFRGESSFKTWITQIVVNCCLMQLRDRRARLRVSLDDVERSVASHTAGPETLCYLREVHAAHIRAASGLPRALRDVYTQSVISGISFRTVINRLRLTPAAAKSRLFRARRKVEHALQSVVRRRAA
jgi:RNA polymerase sigma-70 factor (ECF subfamily)